MAMGPLGLRERWMLVAIGIFCQRRAVDMALLGMTCLTVQAPAGRWWGSQSEPFVSAVEVEGVDGVARDVRETGDDVAEEGLVST